MKNTDDLVQAREQIREDIEKGTFLTITDALLTRMGNLVKIKPGKPFFTETSTLILVLLVTAWAALILFLFEPASQALDDFLLILPMALIIYLGIVGTRKYWHMVMSILKKHLLDAINKLEEIHDLEGWLKSWKNWRVELIFSFLFAFAFDGYFIVAAVLVGDVVPRIAVIIAVLPMFLQLGLLFYDFFRSLSLPLRIQNYNYKLYQADPASSEVIAHLAGLFTAFIFLIAAIAGILTLLLAIINPLPIAGSVFVIAIGWFPLLLTFTITQRALRRIIKHGKQKALNEVQAKVEKLQAQEEIPGEETLKHIRALIDYHDYIKSQRDSTFDIQTGLNFLNSLLFPVIGILVGKFEGTDRHFLKVVILLTSFPDNLS